MSINPDWFYDSQYRIRAYDEIGATKELARELSQKMSSIGTTAAPRGYEPLAYVLNNWTDEELGMLSNYARCQCLKKAHHHDRDLTKASWYKQLTHSEVLVKLELQVSIAQNALNEAVEKDQYVENKQRMLGIYEEERDEHLKEDKTKIFEPFFIEEERGFGMSGFYGLGVSSIVAARLKQEDRDAGIEVESDKWGGFSL